MTAIGRVFSQETYFRLKRKTRELIKAVGGIECAASITRAGAASMGRYGQLDKPDWITIDQVADLEADLGKPVVTEALARATDHVLVPLPEARLSGDPIQQLGSMHKEFGEISQKIGVCLADDGCISRDEVRQHQLRNEIQDAMRELVGMDQLLKQIEEGE